ncbi:hypothetical protein A3860_22710 [Niastella vici]|uniref:Porin n=1 Tax=Niastella vici TaxID=1703345 RepID=A0A1V9FZF5_9BACT|nr:hypothetical protein [Niastella vici]OQP63755.1 hypothetical protein A3860_22710 [Niastella vici]
MTRIYIILYLLTSTIMVNAQDSAITEKKLAISGYFKEMESFNYEKDVRSLTTNNLLHNRINVTWQPHKSITGSFELRNRIFWGDQVRNTPGFASLLRNENEWLNLSALWISRNNFVFQSNIDRCWAEFRQRKWAIRLGRQRINWGLTTAWNPNDIFNTYNFLDFDYEERPGTDAVSFQYNFTDSSTIDVAVNPYGNIKRSIAAARYSIDKRGYHLQMVGGIYQNKLTAGFGWSGMLGNVGYKGEAQAFIAEKDSANRFNYSLELSYTFNKGWFISGSVLHNTSGIDEPVNSWGKIIFRPSPVNPMPARWSFISNISKEFNPALSSNLTLVYSPRINLFIIYPSIKYRLLPHLDADLIYQSFFLELEKQLQATRQTIFLRLKWKF